MAFNNNIALAQKYVGVLDDIYQASARFSILDTANEDLKFINANTVLLPSIDMDGLADYSRNGGFTDGAVDVTWDPYTLTQDRGRGFQVDSQDDEESVWTAFGKLAEEFIRTKVTPEIDAYTAATLAANAPAANIVAETLTTVSDVADAIDTATQVLDDEEVPGEGRILFMSPKAYKIFKGNITRMTVNGEGNVNYNVMMYDDMRVIRVPQARFYTAIDLRDGTTAGEEAGGYAKASGAKDIQLMIVHPTAVRKIVKHVVPRIFSPNENIRADAYAFQYRIYHDCFVLKNKVNGIYLHTEA